MTVPTGGEFASRWLTSFKKFAAEFFSEHLELVASTTSSAADLKAAPCPAYLQSFGLKHAHAVWCGLDPANLPEQWLPPRRQHCTGVVLARSLSKHNDFFPWSQIISHYSGQPLTFCGTAAEKESFSRQFPEATFCWQDSHDLVAATQLLRGSQLLVANQCALAALADGVGVPTVLEVSMLSQTMLHPRQHVFPSFAGKTFLPDVEDPLKGRWVTSPIPESILQAHWPRGHAVRWCHPSPCEKEPMTFHSFRDAQIVVAKLYSREAEDPEVAESILHHTLARFPAEFLPHPDHRGCQRIVRSMARFFGRFPISDYFFQPQSAPELKLLTSGAEPESSPLV